MISYHPNYFQVVINMSQEPIELYAPNRELGGGGGGVVEIAQLIPFVFYSKAKNLHLLFKIGNCDHF